MKKYFILIFVFMLVGCKPTPMDKAKQDFVCRNDGGAYVYAPIADYVQCRSGDKFLWKSVVITDEKYYPYPEQ